MKLLIMQFPPISRHFIPPRSKYSPQHPLLTLSLCSSLNVPMRPLNFLIYLILSRTMALGSTQPPTEMSTMNLPGGVKLADRLVGLTTSPPSVSANCLESVGASMSYNPMGLHGMLQG
jgi:hypothetical protein